MPDNRVTVDAFVMREAFADALCAPRLSRHEATIESARIVAALIAAQQIVENLIAAAPQACDKCVCYHNEGKVPSHASDADDQVTNRAVDEWGEYIAAIQANDEKRH